MFFADLRENSNKSPDAEAELAFKTEDDTIPWARHCGTFWRQIIYDGSEWHDKTVFKKVLFIVQVPSIATGI